MAFKSSYPISTEGDLPQIKQAFETAGQYAQEQGGIIVPRASPGVTFDAQGRPQGEGIIRTNPNQNSQGYIPNVRNEASGGGYAQTNIGGRIVTSGSKPNFGLNN